MTSFFYIIFLLSSLAIIAVVLLQSGRSAGLSGSISGGAESVFGKKRGLDELLSKATGVLAGIFFVSGLAIAFLK